MALFKLDIIKLRGIQAFLLPAAMFVFLVALYVVNHNSRNLFNLHSALSMYEFNIWPGRADQVLRKKTNSFSPSVCGNTKMKYILRLQVFLKMGPIITYAALNAPSVLE